MSEWTRAVRQAEAAAYKGFYARFEEMRLKDWAFTGRDTLTAIINLVDGPVDYCTVSSFRRDAELAAVRKYGLDPDSFIQKWRHRIPLSDIKVPDGVNLDIGIKMLVRTHIVHDEVADDPLRGGTGEVYAIDVNSELLTDLLRDRLSRDIAMTTRNGRAQRVAARERHLAKKDPICVDTNSPLG